MSPLTVPPSGLVKEIVLVSTPAVVDTTVFCKSSGALALYAKRARSSALAIVPKFGRATAHESPTGFVVLFAVLGADGEPAHAEMNTARNIIARFIRRSPMA